MPIAAWYKKYKAAKPYIIRKALCIHFMVKGILVRKGKDTVYTGGYTQSKVVWGFVRGLCLAYSAAYPILNFPIPIN
jgi:hypothetical protein